MVYFISQPMRGRSNMEILAERDRIAYEIHSRDNEALIIDTLFENKEECALRSLGEAIKLMADADVVYFAKGWKDARGCRIEYECACEYQKHIVTEVGE